MARTPLSLYRVCWGLDFARRQWDEKVQWLVHGQVTIFVVSVGLFVCLCRVFLNRL